MKTLTIDDVMGFRPCPGYPRKRVEMLWGGREELYSANRAAAAAYAYAAYHEAACDAACDAAWAGVPWEDLLAWAVEAVDATPDQEETHDE